MKHISIFFHRKPPSIFENRAFSNDIMSCLYFTRNDTFNTKYGIFDCYSSHVSHWHKSACLHEAFHALADGGTARPLTFCFCDVILHLS